MTDAELMTTAPDVPGLEVTVHSWHVNVDGALIGTVYAPFCGDSFGAFCGDNNKDFPTRNDAVQWILDQHKTQVGTNA